MKITLDTLKTIAYAVSKKQQGYKLLKNAKGTSPYEVNMIKSDYYVDRIYHDESFHNVRLTRKKVGDEFVESSTDIFASYLTDPATKKRSGVKNLFIFKKEGNKKPIEKEKWGEPDVWERPLPKWERGEREAHLKELFEKDKQRSFYQPRVSAIEKLFSLGGWKQLFCLEYDMRPEAPSFWSVLKHNLNNVEKK